MKKYLFILLAVFAAQQAVQAQGFQVTLNAPQVRKGIAYLTYYMGPSLNIADSAAVGSNGVTVFSGTKKLLPGIYVLVFPGKHSRIEFLIDKSQKINISAPDTMDLVNKVVISGSPENIPYSQYQKFVSAKGMMLIKEKNAYLSSRTRADSVLHEKNYNTLTKELNDYRQGIIVKQPKSMLAALLSAMKDPKLPKGIPVTNRDSVNQYYYYKNHYWDDVSFMDDRIIRTPFFVTKLERYYKDVLPKDADSVIKDADYKLLLARSAPEMFKYLLNWLTDEYINPEYMGMDKVFVHLFEKYHSKGISNWLNEKQMEAITRRAYMLMSNLVGEKGANLEMLDRNDKPTALYDLQSDYTVLCFWDPNCGHCKTEIPRIDSIYQASWKQKGVKIFAVFTPDGNTVTRADWAKFINSHNLNDWTHVYQSKEKEDADLKAQIPSFKQLYDVITTPTLYLLDNEKRIVGKKLTFLQLDGLLNAKRENKKPN